MWVLIIKKGQRDVILLPRKTQPFNMSVDINNDPDDIFSQKNMRIIWQLHNFIKNKFHRSHLNTVRPFST